MKNPKSIIIYGIIILLCISAFGGYIVTRLSNDRDKTQAVQAVQTINSAEQSTAASEVTGAGTSTVSNGDMESKNEEKKQKHIQQVMNRENEELDPNPTVGVGKGEDFAKATSDAVKNAGGLQNIIKKGDVVLIKPNLCVQTENFGSPMTTDYRVVQEVVKIAGECGASKIIIAEGNFASNAFENLENKYTTIKGAEFYNFNDCEEKDCYELTPKRSLVGKAIFVPKVFMDADVVINVAKLKTHFITNVSLGLKNCIGIPSYKIYGGSSSKDGLHSLGLEEVILDLNKIRKPELTIIDGIIGGEGFGPYANTPVKSNIVFAGKDTVAVDTVALNFMGFDLERVTHVKRAADEKLGIADLNKIKVNGADLKNDSMKFSPAVEY